jgi:hypothetical protein
MHNNQDDGDMGGRATPGVMAPTVGREREKKNKEYRGKPLDYGENLE